MAIPSPIPWPTRQTETFRLSRFPDWSTVPVAVPYANLANPQTLNLYAMVADDPESFADLDGHEGNACGDYLTCLSGGPSHGGSEYLSDVMAASVASSRAGIPPLQVNDEENPYELSTGAGRAQKKLAKQSQPEIVVVVTSDTTHEVIPAPGQMPVTEREVVFTAEQKQGDSFSRLGGDHEVTLQEKQTGGNEKTVICNPCKDKNQIDDQMHVGGRGNTSTVQKEFYVDGKRVAIYGPAWRDKSGKPIPVMKLEGRATDKQVDLVPVQ